MGVYGGPNKIQGGIVFSLDGANPASYAGDEVSSIGTDYGYFGGGFDPSVPGRRSTVDRIDYSSDAPTASPKGPLTSARSNCAAVSSTSYGYFAGGSDPSPSDTTTVDRTDFSNDTPTMSTKGQLAAARGDWSAAGTSSYGYFAGGNHPSPYYSTVYRLDYASDTSTPVEKGPLDDSTSYMGSAGNSSYGYWSGGRDPSAKSMVQRNDYSNDTATASQKGPLSTPSQYGCATGNSSYGYHKAGTNVSIVDRIDYSNDTATAVAKGPLTQGRSINGGATSSRENALPTQSSATRSATQTAGTPYGYVGHGLGSPGNPSPAVSTVNEYEEPAETAEPPFTLPLRSKERSVKLIRLRFSK